MFCLIDFINHAIDRQYMFGVARDRKRVKATAEVFTPSGLVQEILLKLHSMDKATFTDPTKTFLDPSCGDAAFLVGVVYYKLTKGRDIDELSDDEVFGDITSEFGRALSTVYGVDIMMDNVAVSRNRLLCGQEQFRWIVEKNIRCENALTYDFSFE
jgi:hypothetical protein